MPAQARRDVFFAIADPTRREILDLLYTAPLNLNSIAAHFLISRPAISQHIKVLSECGLVTIRQHGRERVCSPEPAELRKVDRWLKGYRSFWAGRLDSLGEHLEKKNKKHGHRSRKKKKGKKK